MGVEMEDSVTETGAGTGPLTQLDVLIVGENEDDVGSNVAAVPLEARLQPLAREEDGSVGQS